MQFCTAAFLVTPSKIIVFVVLRSKVQHIPITIILLARQLQVTAAGVPVLHCSFFFFLPVSLNEVSSKISHRRKNGAHQTSHTCLFHNFEIALSMTTAENTDSASLKWQSNFSDFKLNIHSVLLKRCSLQNKKQASFLAGIHLRNYLHKIYLEITRTNN